jgi:DNA polymerase-3 subunit beta
VSRQNTSASEESIEVDAKAFGQAISLALGAVQRRKEYPILSCVRLVAADGKLEIRATDIDGEIAVSTPAEGALRPTCVDGQRLASISSAVKDRGLMRISVAGDEAVVVAGRSRSTLATMSVDGWPVIAPLETPVTFDVPGAPFCRVLAALDPAISTNDSRYYLCGVCVEGGAVNAPQQPDCMVAIATDGHKCYARHIAVPGLPANFPRSIIPARACRAITKLFAETEIVGVRLSDRRIELHSATIRYSSSLIEGTFPDWRRVISTREGVYSLDVKALLSAVRTTAASVSGDALKLVFLDEETQLFSQEAGNAGFTGQDACPHKLIGTPTINEVGISAAYLAEMAGNLDADTIELSCGSDGGAPIVLTGAGTNDRRVCIMPMRV